MNLSEELAINNFDSSNLFMGEVENKTETSEAFKSPVQVLVTGIILLLFGIVLQLLVISYEMSMDPMKRSITNQVSLFWKDVGTCLVFTLKSSNKIVTFQLNSSNMIWGIFLALNNINEWFFQAIQVQIPLPIKIIFNNFRIICSIAKSLSFMQIFFFIYTNHFVMKKISQYNSDFFSMFIVPKIGQSCSFFCTWLRSFEYGSNTDFFRLFW